MNVEDQAFLADLARQNAIIVYAEGAKAYPAYPRGDLRTRIVAWIEADRFSRLKAQGCLKANKRGFAPVTQRQTGYVPPRPACKPSDVLKRLSRARAGQRPFLTRALVAAARTFIADHTRAHFGEAATQNYDGSGVFTPKTSGTQETFMANRVDAQKRLRDARENLSPIQWQIINAVLIRDMTLREFEAQAGWHEGSAKTSVKAALTELAAHYKSIRR